MKKDKYDNLLNEVSKIPNVGDNKNNMCFLLKTIINDLNTKIQNEMNTASKYVSLTERMEQDILHIIEFSKFNAGDGYKYARLIKEIRNKRRQWKHKQQHIQSLNSQMNKIINDIRNCKHDINGIEKRINELKYTFKVFDIKDI